jgi:hypothetical protein
MAELTNRNRIRGMLFWVSPESFRDKAQISMIGIACRSGSVSQKAIYLTEGGLERYVLSIEKSAEVIVVDRT